MARKAPKVKCWAVRDEYGTYVIVVGQKPRRRQRGSGWCKFKHEIILVLALDWQQIFPSHYWLKPGGGPVLIEFADEA